MSHLQTDYRLVESPTSQHPILLFHPNCETEQEIRTLLSGIHPTASVVGFNPGENWLDKGPYSVILSALHFPGGSIEQLIRPVNDASACPVIALVSSSEEFQQIPGGVMDAIQLGNTSPAEFLQRLSRTIQNWQRFREYIQAEQSFREWADNFPGIAYLFDLDHSRLLYVNHHFQQTWQEATELVLASAGGWLSTVHPEDRSRLEAAWKQAALDCQTVELDYRILLPRRGTFWVRDRATPTSIDRGQAHRLAGVMMECKDYSTQDQFQHVRAQAQARLDVLTTREREVLREIVNGHPNKVIAKVLQISSKTVEMHRANLMHKLKVESVPELMRLVMSANPESLLENHDWSDSDTWSTKLEGDTTLFGESPQNPI